MMRTLAAGALGALALVVATSATGSSAQRSKVSGKVTIVAKWTADEQKSFEAVLAPFKKKNPGVNVKFTGVGDNITQVLSTRSPAGTRRTSARSRSRGS